MYDYDTIRNYNYTWMYSAKFSKVVRLADLENSNFNTWNLIWMIDIIEYRNMHLLRIGDDTLNGIVCAIKMIFGNILQDNMT